MAGTLREEAVKLRENLDKVYEAGQDYVTEKVCRSVTKTGTMVVCHPVGDYPLTVTTESGATTITRCGKNLLDLSEGKVVPVQYVYDTGGLSDARYGVELIVPPGTYTIKAAVKTGTPADYVYAAACNLDKTVSFGFMSPVVNTTLPVETKTFTEWARIYVYNAIGKLPGGQSLSGTMAIFNKYDIQLEVGSEATPFEPYVGESFNVGDIIPSLTGTNVVWADTGNLTVTYTTDRYEEGKQAEHDRFWDVLQIYGNRKDYCYAFYNGGWTDGNFYPKYDFNIIVPSGVHCYMFANCEITDLKGRLEDCCVKLNTGNNYRFSFMFYNAKVLTHIPELDMTLANYTQTMFSGNSKLHTIDKMIFSEDGLSVELKFSGCSALANIVIEGKIANNFNMQWCPLTVESMKSVIGALKDFSGTDKVDTYTLTFSDDCWATLEADSTSPSGGTWEDYVTSLGWLT